MRVLSSSDAAVFWADLVPGSKLAAIYRRSARFHLLPDVRRVALRRAEARLGTDPDAQARSEEVVAGAEDDSLWDRLEREKLARDPSAGTYARLLGEAGIRSGVAEPLIELLDAMRHRVPLEPATTGGPVRSLLELISHPQPTEGEGVILGRRRHASGSAPATCFADGPRPKRTHGSCGSIPLPRLAT